eukprot:4560896-Alexandrium_andersonii.AAC.1
MESAEVGGPIQSQLWALEVLPEARHLRRGALNFQDPRLLPIPSRGRTFGPVGPPTLQPHPCAIRPAAKWNS